MARPSQFTDQKLIQAARELLKTSGLSRVNLRQVAKKAGVNLGMFHYHFKTKDQFIRAVLSDIYERFFKDFNLRIDEQDSPLEKLRQALFTFGQFTRDNRHLVLNIMRDILDHNPEALSFIKANGKRHARIIWDLAGECQRNGSLKKIPRPQAMAFMMPAVAGPNVAFAGVESVASSMLEKGFLKGAQMLVLSDKALKGRVNMALKGLGAESGRMK